MSDALSQSFPSAIAATRIEGTADQARASEDEARRNDQFYTPAELACRLLEAVKDYVGSIPHLWVEPSAGRGAFYKPMPQPKIGVDKYPKCPGVIEGDFLTLPDIVNKLPIATVGNPPFGRQAGMAISFFNHAARWSTIIAFVVPKSFRKARHQNRLNQHFHLVREVEMPKNAFVFNDQPYDVPTVFQIWERRAYLRDLQSTETEHSDFEFVRDASQADFAIRRIGGRAGKLHHNRSVSSDSDYYIKCSVEGVEAIMAQLDFNVVASNTAGPRSLARSEIVSMYRKALEAQAMRGSPGRTTIVFWLSVLSLLPLGILYAFVAQPHPAGFNDVVRSSRMMFGRSRFFSAARDSPSGTRQR